MAFPVLTPDWRAEEELLLIEGLYSRGIGSWEDMAEHVYTKNKFECANHWYEHYIHNPTTGPLPDMSKVINIIFFS
jgi:transcriptional adapter 2-alpha